MRWSVVEMRGSYLSVNYALRPAKAVERKMLAEAITRLSNFASLNTYRYVGLGSTFYSDFLLFHRQLGIESMVSIQSDEGDVDRFKFNLPFECVDLCIGTSTEVLPTLDWSERTILWLDYDYALDNNVLADVEFFCNSAPSGSIILVTLNVKFNGNDKEPLRSLAEKVGEDRVPPGLTAKDLAGPGTASVYKRIARNSIEETLQARNGALVKGKNLKYEQLFYFTYRDGAPMASFGGIICEVGENPKLAACDFQALPFVRQGDESYNIEVPNLTFREIRYLEGKMPCDDAELLPEWIPRKDRESFAKIYRYFPQFAELDI
jgi:hypothetical protein